MSTSRGALHAFHHQLGLAIRHLKRDCPKVAAEILPTPRELHRHIARLAPETLGRGSSAKWPPWRKPGQHAQSPQFLDEEGAEHRRDGTCNYEENFVAPTSRFLKQQDTDETRLPAEGPDLDSISMTESWLDGSVRLGSGAQHVRQHSRRPRYGRRAKARRNQEEYERSSARDARESAFADASSDWPLNMMTALLQTLDEDSCETYQNLGHRHHSCSDERSQCSSSEEDAAAASGEATEHAECGLAQVAGPNYSNRPSPSFEATLSEVSEKLNDSSALQGSLHEKFIIKVIKPAGVSMGMSVEEAGEGMLVNGIFDGGLIDLWNQKCQSCERLAQFDRIVAANVSRDFESMLDSVMGRGQIVLKVLRGSFEREVSTELHPEEVALEVLPMPLEQEVFSQPQPAHEVCLHFERPRPETPEEVARCRQLAMSSGKDDLQKLLTDRLAKSVRDR